MDSMISRKGARVGSLNSPWEKVLHLAVRKSIRRGQTIRISEDAENASPSFYYIISGKVRLSYVGMSGEERTILYAGPGSLMNIPSIIANDVKNTVVSCTEDTEIALFDGALLTDVHFAAENPELMVNLVQSLCIHLVIHSQRLAESSLGDSISQVCRIIVEMMENNNGSTCFAPKMTQQELALILGIHRTTLTRILGRLRDMQVLGKFTMRELQVLNSELLHQLAGDR